MPKLDDFEGVAENRIIASFLVLKRLLSSIVKLAIKPMTLKQPMTYIGKIE